MHSIPSSIKNLYHHQIPTTDPIPPSADSSQQSPSSIKKPVLIAAVTHGTKDFAGQLTSLENLAELLSSTYSKYNNVCKTLPNPNILNS